MPVHQPLPLYPSDDQVTIMWLETCPGFGKGMVGEQLPPDVDTDGTPAVWLETGFLTVHIVGGNPSQDLPTSMCVAQVNCWASVPGSNHPPWAMARQLAMNVIRACRDRTNVPRPLPIHAGSKEYPPAVVRSAVVLTTPRRLYGDAGDVAIYQFDLQVDWLVPSDHID